MIRNMPNANILLNVSILILCIIIENKVPEAFKENGKGRKIKISIDLTDWKHSLFFFTTIGVILFTPSISVIISLFYSLFVAYHIFRYYKG